MQLHTGDVSMTLLLRVCILCGMPTRWQTLYGGPHIYYLPHLSEPKMPVIRRNSIILCTTKNEKTLPITWHTLYRLELRLTLNASALRLILIWIFSYIAFITHKKGNLSKLIAWVFLKISSHLEADSSHLSTRNHQRPRCSVSFVPWEHGCKRALQSISPEVSGFTSRALTPSPQGSTHTCQQQKLYQDCHVDSNGWCTYFRDTKMEGAKKCMP